MKFKRFILSGDTFIRHRCVALLAARYRPGLVADVGGEGIFNLFFGKGVEIQSVNIKESPGVTVKYGGTTLPYEEGSFDLAVSLDTLEHVPKPGRIEFCREMLRISRKAVILCAPLGTDAHIKYEEIIHKKGEMDIDSGEYLKQHIKYGLPTEKEVRGLAGELRGKVYYQGDFRKPSHLRLLEKNRYIISAFNAVVNLFTETAMLQNCELQDAPHAHTNRFFLVVEK